MNYYEVIPASKSYHGKYPLTYAHAEKLIAGQVVRLKLRQSICLAIIVKKTEKPDFDTSEIEQILDKAIIPAAQLSLLQWMAKFYTGPLGATAQLFMPSILEKLDLGDFKPKALTEPLVDSLPALTKEQTKAYQQIKSSQADHQTYLLHGVTGSGKTRLYLELANDALKNNQSVVVLTPEISLTAPIATQFKSVFKEAVNISHSSLSAKQRLELWGKAFAGNQPMIIIGPRSSLFLPLKNLGLIIVDEFHEPAYKQESRPYYHANRVASMLSRLAGAKLLFGSATPPITDYYLAEQKKVPIIKMDRSAITGKPPVEKSIVVDLSDPHEKSSHPLISKTLISHVSDALNRGEQSMLFINKRGSARSIACQDCGFRELCQNCDLPMIYHGDQHLIRCHTCGYNKQPPTKCPSCNSLKIHFTSPGTKAISDSLAKLFPSAKIARFDKDNKKLEKLENTYEQAVNEIDIIVGTQTIAKGHDLPRLSVVAMLLAESSLDFPDFSSEERSYQLIKQLAGRVNRGHRQGVFILQSFKPTSKFITSAVQGSWDDFYGSEVKQRAAHGFPPFYSALKVETSRSSRKSAEDSLEKLAGVLKADFKKLEILGPTPSFIEKKAGKWHWQIIIKAKNRSDLIEIANAIPGSFKLDIDPNNFL